MKIIRKSIYTISESEKKQIDQFIELNNGLLFHETLFNSIISIFFNSKLSYFLAYDGNCLMGVCPCHSFKDGFLNKSFSNMSSFEIPYGGWIYDSDKININKLLSKTKISCNEILQYTSNIQEHSNPYLNLTKFKPHRQNTVILDLSPSLDDMYFSLMKAKQRNKIERAKKLGITAEEIKIEKLSDFIALSRELKDKVNLKIESEELYKIVLAAYKNDKKAVCLAAKYNNEYISAMILLSNTNFTIAWVAGRKAEIANNLYQNELLWWETIVYSKNWGSKYLDLCGLDEEKLPHLARIKLSFSKDIRPFYSLTKISLIAKVLNKINKLFS